MKLVTTNPQDFITSLSSKKNNSKKISIIVSAIVLLIISIMLGEAVGNIEALSNKQPISILNAFTSLKGIITIIAFYIISMSAVLIYLFCSKTDTQTKEDYVISKNNTYGKSHKLREAEYSQFLQVADHACEITGGYIIGRSLESNKVVAIPKKGVNNRNMGICGCQGTQKSLSVIRNLAISAGIMGHSVLLTDPKGELTKDLYPYFKTELGYKNVWQLNLINHWVSNSWDILGEIKHGNIDILCDTIIANTRPSDDHDFFDDIETLLLKSLMLYVVDVYPIHERTIGSVYSILEYTTLDELDDMFFELKKNNPKSPAIGPYNMFSGSNNKANAFLGLGGRMRVFGEEVIKHMTGYDEIDLMKIAKEKTAIFCVFPDTNATYNVIISTFITIFLTRVFEYGKLSMSGKCDVPVDLILDELPSVGDIKNFDKMLSTARSYDIGIQFVFQNIPQIKDRFGKDLYKHYLGSCDYNLFLGCNDDDTAKDYSNRSGDVTIIDESTKQKLDTIRITDYTENFDITTKDGKRKLYLASDLLNLDSSVMILYCHGQDAIELRKMPFYEIEEALCMKKINQNELIPEWRINIEQGQTVYKTYEELYKEAPYVVTDYYDSYTESYLYTREGLIKEANKVMSKYQKEGKTPNGMPLIINGERIKQNNDAGVNPTNTSLVDLNNQNDTKELSEELQENLSNELTDNFTESPLELEMEDLNLEKEESCYYDSLCFNQVAQSPVTQPPVTQPLTKINQDFISLNTNAYINADASTNAGTSTDIGINPDVPQVNFPILADNRGANKTSDATKEDMSSVAGNNTSQTAEQKIFDMIKQSGTKTEDEILKLIREEIEKELTQRAQLKRFEKEEKTLTDEQIKILIKQEVKLHVNSVIEKMSNATVVQEPTNDSFNTPKSVIQTTKQPVTAQNKEEQITLKGQLKPKPSADDLFAFMKSK